jgi:chromosome segregation ATPase
MSADDLRQEIELTRQRLGETVDELAAKADVKARARDKAIQVKAQAQDQLAKTTARTREQVAEVSGRVSQNETVRRRWPVALSAAVALAAAVAIWRWRQS